MLCRAHIRHLPSYAYIIYTVLSLPHLRHVYRQYCVRSLLLKTSVLLVGVKLYIPTMAPDPLPSILVPTTPPTPYYYPHTLRYIPYPTALPPPPPTPPNQTTGQWRTDIFAAHHARIAAAAPHALRALHACTLHTCRTPCLFAALRAHARACLLHFLHTPLLHARTRRGMLNILPVTLQCCACVPPAFPFLPLPTYPTIVPVQFWRLYLHIPVPHAVWLSSSPSPRLNRWEWFPLPFPFGSWFGRDSSSCVGWFGSVHTYRRTQRPAVPAFRCRAVPPLLQRATYTNCCSPLQLFLPGGRMGMVPPGTRARLLWRRQPSLRRLRHTRRR